jgi:hypothetical protein
LKGFWVHERNIENNFSIIKDNIYFVIFRTVNNKRLHLIYSYNK